MIGAKVEMAMLEDMIREGREQSTLELRCEKCGKVHPVDTRQIFPIPVPELSAAVVRIADAAGWGSILSKRGDLLGNLCPEHNTPEVKNIYQVRLKNALV